MSNFYIYSLKIKEKVTEHKSVSVLFCHGTTIDNRKLEQEIKEFYETHMQTDYFLVIGGEYLQNEIREIFINQSETTFRFIPKAQKEHLQKQLFLLIFNSKGFLKEINNKNSLSNFYSEIVNVGLKKIFINRGGLIEAPESHHFVFPSGKHCSKFLRTGNILLYSSEIYFIAFNLLKFFDEENITQIYCDTSSINTLAFSLIELKQRFNSKVKFIPIESFSSYEAFEKQTLKYGENSLILVSSSTSCNIVDRLLKSINTIKRENIIILFYLGNKSVFNENRSQIVCNLTKLENDLLGVEEYKTHSEIDCHLCKNGSMPVKVIGDVFLLEKPKVNLITFIKKDAPSYLSDFVEEFITNDEGNNILKCHYKESSNPDEQYDIYFDMDLVFEKIEVDNHHFIKFKEKFRHVTNTFVPANTKYIIPLPDKSSKLFATKILDKMRVKFKDEQLPEIILQNEIDKKISKDEKGSVLVVGSTVVLGRNLLYISRALRDYENCSISYIIGIARTINEDYLGFLKKNLGQGKYGTDTYPFIPLYTIFCENDFKESTWLHELSFNRSFKDFLENNFDKYSNAINFINLRIEYLEQKGENGMATSLFLPLPNLTEELKLRKNFAFFNFDNYVGKVSQGDVYFTISSIINKLRHEENMKHSLRQSEYVRNLIDPSNFERFNDGIIQASILRAANLRELSYNIDDHVSLKMKLIIDNILDNVNDENSEALLEFVYAIVSKKLKMINSHRDSIFLKLYSLNNNIITAYLDFFEFRNTQ